MPRSWAHFLQSTNLLWPGSLRAGPFLREHNWVRSFHSSTLRTSIFINMCGFEEPNPILSMTTPFSKESGAALLGLPGNCCSCVLTLWLSVQPFVSQFISTLSVNQNVRECCHWGIQYLGNKIEFQKMCCVVLFTAMHYKLDTLFWR